MGAPWWIVCPYAPIYPHMGGCYRESAKLELFGFYTFSDWDPGTPGSCASYVGTTPLLFRDMLPTWVSRARLNAETGHQRSDMTFRQNNHYSNGFWSNRGNLVLFWALRYDVTRGVTPRAQRLSIDHHVVCSGCQGFMGVRPMTSERQPGPCLGPKPELDRSLARWGNTVVW